MSVKLIFLIFFFTHNKLLFVNFVPNSLFPGYLLIFQNSAYTCIGVNNDMVLYRCRWYFQTTQPIKMRQYQIIGRNDTYSFLKATAVSCCRQKIGKTTILYNSILIKIFKMSHIFYFLIIDIQLLTMKKMNLK